MKGLSCFGCKNKINSPSPSRQGLSVQQATAVRLMRNLIAQEQKRKQAAIVIQRYARGMSARTKLRDVKAAVTTMQKYARGGLERRGTAPPTYYGAPGSFYRRTIREQLKAVEEELKKKGLPAELRKNIINKAKLRLPVLRNRQYAPKQALSPNLQQWLRVSHRRNNVLNEQQYNEYLNRVWNYQHSQNRENKIKSILARYELLQPLKNYPNAAVSKSPRVIKWRSRLETNFRRKYIPRGNNRLSSRELYTFLKTAPMEYLTRTARTAPNYA